MRNQVDMKIYDGSSIYDELLDIYKLSRFNVSSSGNALTIELFAFSKNVIECEGNITWTIVNTGDVVLRKITDNVQASILYNIIRSSILWKQVS